MENQKNNINEKAIEALENVEVVGIKFREGGKTYYFAPGKIVLNKDDHAIVETARGMEFGICALGNRKVKPADIVSPLKPVVRVATEDDERRHEQNKVMEEKAKQILPTRTSARESSRFQFHFSFSFIVFPHSPEFPFRSFRACLVIIYLL